MDNSTTLLAYQFEYTSLLNNFHRMCSPSMVVTTALWQIYSLLFKLMRSLQAKGSGCRTCDLRSIVEFQPSPSSHIAPYVPWRRSTANSVVQVAETLRRSRVWSSVVGPFSMSPFSQAVLFLQRLNSWNQLTNSTYHYIHICIYHLSNALRSQFN